MGDVAIVLVRGVACVDHGEAVVAAQRVDGVAKIGVCKSLLHVVARCHHGLGEFAHSVAKKDVATVHGIVDRYSYCLVCRGKIGVARGVPAITESRRCFEKSSAGRGVVAAYFAFYVRLIAFDVEISVAVMVVGTLAAGESCEANGYRLSV